MVTPLVHMGLGYDDLLVPALVHAGFETKDLVLVVRTDANLAWVRRHAPRATTVRLPYAAARKANVVSGLAPHAALKRACAGVGLDVLDLLVSERALRRNRVDTAMNFLNLAAEELEAAIAGRGPVLALTEFTVTSELLTAGLVTHHGGLATWPRGIRLPSDRFGLIGAPKGITLWQRQVEDAAALGGGPGLHPHVAGRAGPPDGLRPQPQGRVGPGGLAARDRPRQGVRRRPRRQPPAAQAVATTPVCRGSTRSRPGSTCGSTRTAAGTRCPSASSSSRCRCSPSRASTSWARSGATRPTPPGCSPMRLAPLDIGVAVKEHAHFMWRRDPDYWPQFDAHPNIATIDPFADSRELMQQAVFTVTATGTVGLEAGLLGLPVVTGAEMPWSGLGNVARLDYARRPHGVRRRRAAGSRCGPTRRRSTSGSSTTTSATRGRGSCSTRHACPPCSSPTTSARSVAPSPRPRRTLGGHHE